MADAITMQGLIDANLDVETLGEAANEDKVVVSRLGREFVSAPMASRLIMEQGTIDATLKTTKADLDADTVLVDGDFALVYNDDDVELNGYYQKQSGVWEYLPYNVQRQALQQIEQAKQAATTYTNNKVAQVEQSVDFKKDLDLSEIAWALADETGRAPVSLSNDSTLNTVAVSVPSGRISHDDNTEIAAAWRDSEGNDAFIVKADGTIAMDSLDVRLINGQEYNAAGGGGIEPVAPAEVQKPSGYTAENNGVASYGQSLAAGSTSTPVISTVQNYDNLMFNSGTRPSDGGTDPNVIYASLVPLVESVDSVNGETPLSGMTDNIKELILNEESLAYTDMSYKFLGSAPAQGGQNISSLTKGSDYYLRLTNDVKYGAIRAADTNQSYAYQATTWLQGEADYSAGTTKAVYKLILGGLIDDIAADTTAETKQTFNPEFIIGQVGSHLRYAQSAGVTSAFKADIAQAQLELSKERNDAHLACPSYQFDYSGTVNQVHLTATDERVMGAYFGLVYKRVVIDGQDWQPLQPVAITKSKRSVYITLNNASALAIDTDWVTQNTDYGFRVFDNGVQANIADVSIVNGNAIKITLESDLLGVMTVDYALFSNSPTGETGRVVGARGNIRDSQGDTIIFDPTGVNRPLHNWLVMFTYTDGDKL